jgi:glutamate-1-semialdehyde 2,1-aminomutase
MRIARSRSLFQRASRILPGGVDSPVRAFKAVGASPLFVRRARGSRLEDVDGNTFIDYVMSWGPLIHGHAPPGLVRAVAAAARDGTSYGAPSPLEVELGERVRGLMPSLERVRFVNSGTEAAMSAVRVARAATKRELIVKFEGCYHGHADAFLVAAGSGALTLGVPTSPGVTRGAAGDTLVARYNDLDSVHRLFDGHRGAIAAVIVEPLAGNMGVVPPADGFLQALREVCTAAGTLLIFDEVISGFRMSAGGAQAVMNVRPDLTCLGKIIGGGLPVGAYGGRADLMELVSPAGPVYQAGTLSGNPLAMTAGIWALDHLSPRLYLHLAALTTRLAAGLADAARRACVALQVNAAGSVLTPFFTDRPVRDYRAATSADTAQYGRFFRGLITRGVYPPPSQFEAWFLSAAHTVRDVDQTIAAAREVMAGLQPADRFTVDS